MQTHTISEKPANNASKAVIIAGFLGSGKTTLLRKLVEYDIARGGQPHIIMSEFGDIDIDGVLIADGRTLLTTITGGCACCDLREQLSEGFRDAIIVSPRSTIIIESTGVGDPAGILKALQPYTDEGIAVVTAVVVIYDASRPLLEGRDRDLVTRQVKAADIIVINKIDMVPQEALPAILDDIRELNPGAKLVVTSHGEIDFENVLTGVSGVTADEDDGETSQNFHSLGFQIEDPLSQPALEKWLKGLPASVVRVKGFVTLAGQDGIHEVQATSGHIVITPFTGVEKPPAMLVVITHPMRTDGLVRGLMRCVSG
ncbi:MAG: GTP-binding protein [Dehalococcoidales bacterium]|jgi:G3E family GTPase|nr:GTP-binding protein [Dehalococcoidales bacterium]